MLCVASDARDYLAQLASVLAAGSRAVMPANERTRRLAGEMPAAVRDAIDLVEWWSGHAKFDVVLHHGTLDERAAVLARVAARDGPIAAVYMFDPGEEVNALERLLLERVVSVNTAAAGGNATLMTVG